MALSALYWDTCQSFSARVINVTVRREKALNFSGCNSRPETGSLHPAVMRVLGVLANRLKCTSTFPVQITRRVLSVVFVN